MTGGVNIHRTTYIIENLREHHLPYPRRIDRALYTARSSLKRMTWTFPRHTDSTSCEGHLQPRPHRQQRPQQRLAICLGVHLQDGGIA